MWRGGLGSAYLWPTLSSAGASLASPCSRFHIPLIEPDVRICRIRLSDGLHGRSTDAPDDAAFTSPYSALRSRRAISGVW